MLDLSVHKAFSKDLKKVQLNPTNTAKLFMFISLLLNKEELPAEVDKNLTICILVDISCSNI